MPQSANETWKKLFLKFGHGGASGHALANSLESLEIALKMGVDVVEFDVLPYRDALVLHHDDDLTKFNSTKLASLCTLDELRSMDFNAQHRIATLAEALDLLKGRYLINIDLMAAGYETEGHEMVAARDLTGDVIYSSVIASSLQRVRELDPQVMIGLSYPEDRSNSSRKPALKPIVEVVVMLMRAILPYRILKMVRNANADAVMLYHKVIAKSSIQDVHRTGGKVFCWIVDDAARMRQLKNLGVDGITTNYPDLFGTI